MIVSLIVAISRNSVIGQKGKLPWHLSEDLKRFKAITMGHSIIMGRKTFESIGKPLSGRLNIIITRNADYIVPGTIVTRSIEEALAVAKTEEESKKDAEVFIIGGAELYKQALAKVERIYLTHIDQDFEGDAFLSEVQIENLRDEFTETAREDRVGPPNYSFVILERKGRN